ncbi:transposase [Glycomyces salinus]|uniref:transposase n=1 Tax=Glycomyces salinus TaxID=980294 RepID=UPI0018EDC673
MHATTDRIGLPLSVEVSAAGVRDKRLLGRTVDKIGPIRQRFGRPWHCPDKLHGDKGYDYDDCRAALRKRGITPPGWPGRRSNRPSARAATGGSSSARSPG